MHTFKQLILLSINITQYLKKVLPYLRLKKASGFVPPGLVKRVCDQRRNKWRRTGRLLARAGYVSPCCKVVFMVYVLLCWGVFFSVLTLYSSMEHSLGVNFFFSSLSSCNAVIFFNSLSSCPVYPLVCMLCMGRWRLISLVLVTKWQ